jgi:hypothetical protein
MAQFRFDNARIAFGQRAHARKTIALVETFIGFTPAGDAMNFAGIGQSHGFADEFIHGYAIVSHGQMIDDRFSQLGLHFA